MKKLSILILSIFSLAMFSCEGPAGPIGPQGPQGPEGQPGYNILGQVFEAEANFNADNGFQEFYDFPSFIGDRGQIYESDLVLAYLLYDVSNGLDVWEQIPTMRFLDGNRIYQFGFDHSMVDFSLFMQGNFNLATLNRNETQGLVFRIAVIPADFAKLINTDNLAEVMQKANLTEADVIKL